MSSINDTLATKIAMAVIRIDGPSFDPKSTACKNDTKMSAFILAAINQLDKLANPKVVTDETLQANRVKLHQYLVGDIFPRVTNVLLGSDSSFEDAAIKDIYCGTAASWNVFIPVKLYGKPLMSVRLVSLVDVIFHFVFEINKKYPQFKENFEPTQLATISSSFYTKEKAMITVEQSAIASVVNGFFTKPNFPPSRQEADDDQSEDGSDSEEDDESDSQDEEYSDEEYSDEEYSDEEYSDEEYSDEEYSDEEDIGRSSVRDTKVVIGRLAKIGFTVKNLYDIKSKKGSTGIYAYILSALEQMRKLSDVNRFGDDIVKKNIENMFPHVDRVIIPLIKELVYNPRHLSDGDMKKIFCSPHNVFFPRGTFSVPGSPLPVVYIPLVKVVEILILFIESISEKYSHFRKCFDEDIFEKVTIRRVNKNGNSYTETNFKILERIAENFNKDSAPKYSAPKYSAPKYSAPKYSAPKDSASAPRYSAFKTQVGAKDEQPLPSNAYGGFFMQTPPNYFPVQPEYFPVQPQLNLPPQVRPSRKLSQKLDADSSSKQPPNFFLNEEPEYFSSQAKYFVAAED